MESLASWSTGINMLEQIITIVIVHLSIAMIVHAMMLLSVHTRE